MRDKLSQSLSLSRTTASKKGLQAVTPAKAGVQKFLVSLDSGQRTTLVRFRRNDKNRYFSTCCEAFKDGVPEENLRVFFS